MNAKRYNSIDLWKLIMAFCVVALHTITLEQSKLIIINEPIKLYEATLQAFIGGYVKR